MLIFVTDLTLQTLLNNNAHSFISYLNFQHSLLYMLLLLLLSLYLLLLHVLSNLYLFTSVFYDE